MRVCMRAHVCSCVHACDTSLSLRSKDFCEGGQLHTICSKETTKIFDE